MNAQAHCFTDLRISISKFESSAHYQNVLITGEVLASHLLRYWLGVFPEHTEQGDALYSEPGDLGELSSCGQADWFRLCPPHKEYNR